MNEEEDYYVYMVRCSDGSLYTGSTNNLPARIEKHNRGEGARYTRGRRPVTLVYSESAASKSDALKREIQIKKMTRVDKLSLIKEHS